MVEHVPGGDGGHARGAGKRGAAAQPHRLARPAAQGQRQALGLGVFLDHGPEGRIGYQQVVRDVQCEADAGLTVGQGVGVLRVELEEQQMVGPLVAQV